MIDVHELLRKKENDINRIRKEIDALQLVAPLLTDSEEGSTVPANSRSDYATAIAEEDVATDSPHEQSSVEAEPIEASSDPIPPKRGILRDWFNRAAGE